MHHVEISRLESISIYENRARLAGYKQIAGVDEAGRGPLAGPVVASACILPPSFFLENINDSKQLNRFEREELYTSLVNNPEVHYGIGIVDEREIDRINILQASLFAMLKAIDTLPKTPDYLLVDGNRMPHTKIAGEAIIKGDGASISIAAASIIAKVTRDRLMDMFHEKYPQYGFNKHKGYATEEHREAISKFGPSPIHRKTFEPIKSFFDLDLPFFIP